jgi:SAM-dependent methyltransferase
MLGTQLTSTDPGGVVLDVGRGVGHDLELLAGAGLELVGLDPSAAVLTAARRPRSRPRLPSGRCLQYGAS